jgi:ribose 5-phosphate isomerase B
MIMGMRIHLATDHAGLELSAIIAEHCRTIGHEVVDHGPVAFDPLDDYPSFCINAALGVRRDEAAGIEALAIVFGGSGNGEQMAANKVAGIRAALVWSEATAALAREHNNANVCAIGARQHSSAEVLRLIDVFLETPYPGDERHARRIAQLFEYETTGDIAGFVIE